VSVVTGNIGFGGIEKKHGRTTSESTTAISEHDGADTRELWADYDDLLARLKIPPPKLTW
jgi:hypothetical protein